MTACTYVFTEKGEALDFRQADLVVTADVVWQRLEGPVGADGVVREGEAEARVVIRHKGRALAGDLVKYKVRDGHDGLCPVLWSTAPGARYKLYLKRPKDGGLPEIIHRLPHFGP